MCMNKIQPDVLYGVFTLPIIVNGVLTLPNKSKIIKQRSNIFKIDSVVSTKLSLSSSMLPLSVIGLIDSKFDDPVFGIIWLVLCLCPIGTTSTLLVVIGILQYLSNNSLNELLMIGIVLVRNSAKPTIYGTADSDSPSIR